MNLSPQQQNVMDWASKDDGHLNLVARAGCGKTTTLIELCKETGPSTFLGAYNKKIAEEIKGKLQAKGLKAEASTLHAAGFRAWRAVAPSVRVDDRKLWNLAKDQGIPRDQQATIVQAVSLAKQSLAWKEGEWLKMWNHFGLDLDLKPTEDVIQRCFNLLSASTELNEEIIDFDDMLYAPVQSGCRLPQYSWVLIDEAQDTNPCRRELAIRMLNGGSRLVAVGDDRQAIYGFTGADADAMNLIRDRLDSKELPLNITYRCPKELVRLAQTWVPDIQAADTAPEGKVRQIHESKFSILDPQNHDVILCRNTKPLIELAYEAIKAGRGVRVEGREIGIGLIRLAEKFKEQDLRRLQPRLSNYLQEEVSSLNSQGRPEKIQAIEDKVETLQLLITQSLENGGNDLFNLKQRIEGLFGDTYGSQTLLTLSTVHKAKGREWDRVWLWGRNRYIPSWYAIKAREKGMLWPLQQEDNLCYVAVTRAKKELVEIEVEVPWKNGKK
jgi:superfamily I DNA/RNA helicase